MERGEIWLVSLDPTAGHEQQGTRPVPIVTPAAFRRVTRLPVVVPVTVQAILPALPALLCRWMVLVYIPQELCVAINPEQSI